MTLCFFAKKNVNCYLLRKTKVIVGWQYPAMHEYDVASDLVDHPSECLNKTSHRRSQFYSFPYSHTMFHIFSYMFLVIGSLLLFGFLFISLDSRSRVYASINIPREVYVQATSHYEAGYKVGLYLFISIHLVRSNDKGFNNGAI